MVTHPSTNWAQRTVTFLMRQTTLVLRQHVNTHAAAPQSLKKQEQQQK